MSFRDRVHQRTCKSRLGTDETLCKCCSGGYDRGAEDKALRSGHKARKNALINTISRVQAKLESIVEKDDRL